MKHKHIWIEGEGTMRSVFRKFALWEYATQESCKALLTKTLERENVNPGPHVLQYVLEKRKREIQWISLYLPFPAFLITSGAVFYCGVLVHQIHLGMMPLIKGGILSILIIVAYLITFYKQYLEARKFLSIAGDNILHELNEKVQNHVVPITNPEPPESYYNPNKGTISMILLHELIKKECGKPNIYNSEIHKSVTFYSQITGCKPKNILGKATYYKSREDLPLNTPNSRTTHLKYLDRLLEYYLEIGDDALYNKAEDLQSFIEGPNKK